MTVDDPIRETQAPGRADASDDRSATLPRGGGRRAGDLPAAVRGAPGPDERDASRGRRAAASLTERLEETFERRIAEFVSAARRTRAASDPEAIHDLRVAARRLTAAIRTWRSLVPTAARRDACRALRRLRRRLGSARELEVHVELLEARLPARRTVTRAAAAALLLRLKGRLAKRRRAACRRAGPRRVKRMLRLLEGVAGGLPARLLRDPGAVEAALATEREAGVAARESVRRAAELQDDASLHEARIQVKKWRYRIECIDDALPGRSAQGVRALRRIQEALGDIHDRITLRDAIARESPVPGDERGPHPLRPLIDKLEGERRRALRKFQRLAAVLTGAPQRGAPPVPAAGETSPATTPPSAPSGVFGPAAEPAAAIAPKDPAPREAAKAGAPEPAAPRPDIREERWVRMADWLEKLEEGS